MPVTNNKEKSRYELNVNGLISVADYSLEGDTLTITHVGVPPELRGKGIAAQVMDGVIADATEQNLHINPVCPYAATHMARHKL